METTTKEKTIIFYGKNFTPLSKDCYGCYHFGTICEGSVYRTECPTGQVEDIRPSIAASMLLRATDNRFTLARSFGYDIATEVNKKDLEGNQKLLQEFEAALDAPESVIRKYKNLYSLDLYAEEEIPNVVYDKPVSDSTETGEDPFEGAEVVDIQDGDLPF